MLVRPHGCPAQVLVIKGFSGEAKEARGVFMKLQESREA